MSRKVSPELDEKALAVSAALARCVGGDKAAPMDFFGLLFRFRQEMLDRFPGKSRQLWYDPDDAFSETVTEVYEAVVKGELTTAPQNHKWHAFLHERMRKKLWIVKRRDSRTLTADAGQEALLNVEASEKDNPSWRIETRGELEGVVPKVKALLSPKQQAVFFANAEGLQNGEVARVAKTTPGSARTHQSNAEKKLDQTLRAEKKRAG